MAANIVLCGLRSFLLHLPLWIHLQGNDEKDVSSMYLTLDYLPEEKVDTKLKAQIFDIASDLILQKKQSLTRTEQTISKVIGPIGS